MLLDFIATFFASASTLLPFVARDVLHVDELGYGRLAAAQSIGAVDLPGAPVRLLAFGVRFAPLFLLQRILQPMVGGGRGDKPPSLLVDMRSGKTQSEIDALNGAIVQTGKSIGVPMPVNAALVGIVHDLLDGKADRAAWRRNIHRLVELTAA